MSQKIILFLCGAFNPPTIMHLRVFELARDYLTRIGGFEVIGGIMSPVHDRYGKKDMATAVHRLEMARLAATTIPWVKVSPWEVEQEDWTRTRAVMDYHQNALDNFGKNAETTKPMCWMPDGLIPGESVRLKLLCGADVLESMNVPNLWGDDDIKTLAGTYGMLVISREGEEPQKSIAKHCILNGFENNIHIVVEPITNGVSSTKMRSALRRKESVKYFVPDPVVEYLDKVTVYTPSPSDNDKVIC